ncbi:MAG TPA: hypothetical protein VNT26_03190, partial [Candidatus Sulfotelmatobacter sp.]|nr:hypothetical protein [Candidatus Sulfotelmatobacter sp.]
QGHVALGFSVAGANEFINAGTASRLANDPLGALRVPTLYTASSTAYNPAGDPGGSRGRRWGDYSFTSLDPGDDMTMWTIQEFCSATDTYGVRVVKLPAPPPATPVSCSPASLSVGVTNIDLVLTGASNGDTGFFDPGLGFSNRLAAAISGNGDVTINRLTYTDPTHLTLNLSVSSAAAGGARTITVTNPDGQSAASATGILSIVPWPSLSAIAVSGTSATLTWTAVAGQTYRLEYKEDITALTWTAVTPDVTASGPTATLTNSIGSSTQRFYRVFLLP